MKKLLQLLTMTSACLFGVNGWAVDPVAVWLSFDELTADSPLAPQISTTLNNIDGRAWAFYLGGGTVNGDKSLQTKGNQAPYISLGSGGLDIGYNNKPITILLAIEAPLTPQENKPILSAQASSGDNGAGFATTSASDVTQIKGTLNGSIWSDNRNPGFACSGLAADFGTIYLAISMFDSSHGSSLGVITPGENGSVAWNDVTGLKGVSYSVNNLYFGNFRDGTSGGLDYKLKGVAVYPTAYADDESLLAGVELLSSTEPAATYTWSNADASATATDTQTSQLFFTMPAGDGLKSGETVLLQSVTVALKSGSTATDWTECMMYVYSGTQVSTVPTEKRTTEWVSAKAVVTSEEFLSRPAVTFNFSNLPLTIGTQYRAALVYNNYNAYASSGTYFPLTEMSGNIINGSNSPLSYVSSSVTHYIGAEVVCQDKIVVPENGEIALTEINAPYVTQIGDGATLLIDAKTTIDLSNVILFGKNVTVKVPGLWRGEAFPTLTLPNGVQVNYAMAEGIPEGVLSIDSTIGAVTENVTPLDYELTWMPIGDSITEGEANMGTESDTVHGGMGYRYHLWKQLEEGGQLTRTVGYRTGHCGVNEDPATVKWAWHCAQYSGSIQPLSTHAAQMYNIESAFENAGYPDVISVLIGINDLEYSTKSASGLNTTDSDTVNKEQADLIYAEWVKFIEKIAKNRPHSKIVVSTLLPVRSTGQSGHPLTEKRRKLFNAKMRLDAANPTGTLFENSNIIFVDVAELAFGDEFNGDLIKSSTDWAHPNEEGSKLVAKAFRLGLLKAIKDIQDETKTPLAIAQVHNGVQNKVIARLNKAVNPTVCDKLKLSLSTDSTKSVTLGIDSEIGTTSTRELIFDSADSASLIIGLDKATLLKSSTNEDTGKEESTPFLASNTDTDFDIVGSGAKANVPTSFLPNTYQKYATITIHDNADNTGTSANDDVVLEGIAPALISRVGYYVELKRENQPAQFVWVSMDAGGEFQNSVANVGLPESKIIRGYVENLQVYGNRGNFDHEVSEAGVRGWVEFSPYEYGTTDRDDAPAEVYAGVYGWNDTLEEVTSHLGCMQVARVLKDSDATWNDPAAEMLFGYSEFRTSSYKSSLGIGSLSISRSDTASNGSLSAATYDWTFASQFSAYQASQYDVKKIEIWVEEMPKETWIGGAADEWSDNSKWADGTAPTSTDIEVELAKGSILTLTSGNYSTSFSGAGALAIAKDAKVTLSGANTYSGDTSIGANATLIVESAAGFVNSRVSGDATGKFVAKGFIPSTTLLPATGENAWTGGVKIQDYAGESLAEVDDYTNAAYIEIENVQGWAPIGGLTFKHLKISGKGFIFDDGTSTSPGINIVVENLSGDGTIQPPTNTRYYQYVVKNIESFTGKIDFTTTGAKTGYFAVTIGNSATTHPNNTATEIFKKVTIKDDKTLDLTSLQSWQLGDAAVVIDGAVTLKTDALPTGVVKVLATTGTKTLTDTSVKIKVGDSIHAGWTLMSKDDGVYLRRKGFMLIVK